MKYTNDKTLPVHIKIKFCISLDRILLENCNSDEQPAHLTSIHRFPRKINQQPSWEKHLTTTDIQTPRMKTYSHYTDHQAKLIKKEKVKTHTHLEFRANLDPKNDNCEQQKSTRYLSIYIHPDRIQLPPIYLLLKQRQVQKMHLIHETTCPSRTKSRENTDNKTNKLIAIIQKLSTANNYLNNIKTKPST